MTDERDWCEKCKVLTELCNCVGGSESAGMAGYAATLRTKTMTNKQLKLAAEFLDQLSENMGNAGCNDWDWPSDWSGCERDQFAREFHQMNGDHEEFEPGMNLPDFCAVDLLAAALRRMAA